MLEGKRMSNVERRIKESTKYKQKQNGRGYKPWNCFSQLIDKKGDTIAQ